MQTTIKLSTLNMQANSRFQVFSNEIFDRESHTTDEVK